MEQECLAVLEKLASYPGGVRIEKRGEMFFVDCGEDIEAMGSLNLVSLHSLANGLKLLFPERAEADE